MQNLHTLFVRIIKLTMHAPPGVNFLIIIACRNYINIIQQVRGFVDDKLKLFYSAFNSKLMVRFKEMMINVW